MNDDRAPLRDLDPFVHVRSRIFSTNDVFGGREKSPEPDGDDSDR